jgi:hypothetical protein
MQQRVLLWGCGSVCTEHWPAAGSCRYAGAVVGKQTYLQEPLVSCVATTLACRWSCESNVNAWSVLYALNLEQGMCNTGCVTVTVVCGFYNTPTLQGNHSAVTALPPGLAKPGISISASKAQYSVTQCSTVH